MKLTQKKVNENKKLKPIFSCLSDFTKKDAAVRKIAIEHKQKKYEYPEGDNIYINIAMGKRTNNIIILFMH